MEESELDLNLEETQENINSKNRFKELADKVKEKSQLADANAKAKEEEAQARANAEKERDFYKNFNQVSSKYPGANDYQDKILEKVNSGYDLEDATISILAKEGKYTSPEPKIERESPAGGSADIGLRSGEEKSPDSMSQEERYKALKDLEKKGEFHL